MDYAYDCDDGQVCSCDDGQEYMIFYYDYYCYYDDFYENWQYYSYDSCSEPYALDVFQLTQTLKVETLGPVLMCPLDMRYQFHYSYYDTKNIYCYCDDEHEYMIFYYDEEEEDMVENYPHELESMENYDDSCNADTILFAFQLLQAVELVIIEPFLVCLLQCRCFQNCCNCCVCFIECLGYFIVVLIFLLVTWAMVEIQSVVETTVYVETFFIPLCQAWIVFDVLLGY